MYEYVYLPKARFPDLTRPQLEGSLTRLLADTFDLHVSDENIKVKVSALYDKVAEALEHSNGAPCLDIQRTRYEGVGSGRRAFEFDIEYWVHSALELHIDSE